MTEKSKISYMQADGSWISFREAMSDFAPSKEEFAKLRAEIVKIIGKETTPDFDDTLDFLITLLRDKIHFQENATSITIVQKELSGLINQLNKLQKYMDTNISDMSQMHLTSETIKWMSDTDSEDPFYVLQSYAKTVHRICETTKNNIKGQKPPFTTNDMRQTLAEELARELDKMGIQPKKYREGEFVEALSAVLRAVSCKVNGRRISISIPADLFKVASKAIDEFPDKEPYALLALD